ncbi:MAG: GNAT family N-acetyltransferase [Dehalococcoidales bacterium]|nr:GNAT family N-acetyltransferase [Dehalococcoidales bacterium]
MIEIRPLTKEDVTGGLIGPGAYCLAKLPSKNWSTDPDERSMQQKRQVRYLELTERFGTMALLALEDHEVAGFIIFIPKTIARRLGFYTLPGDKDLDRTMVATCLHVAQSKRGQGIAVKLIEGAKKWATSKGYTSMEAIGEGFAQYGWHASAPFLSAGFRICSDYQHGSWRGQLMQAALT